MMDIGKWSLGNRKLIYFLVAVLTVGGAIAYMDMSKLEDPEITVKQALIVTTYPGASAHQVELEVTDPLEKSIRSMKDVEQVISRSMNDVSIIDVRLSTLVQDDDVQQCWDMLRGKVGDAAAGLPAGAGTPVVRDDFGDVFGMFYAITSDGYTYRELGRYAEMIKREVLEIEGISQVEIYGERRECINIELYEDRMANLGVLPAEVLMTLTGQNQTVYSGYYGSGDKRIRVTVNDKYRDIGDIEMLLIEGHQGDQLRLRDIAAVTKGYEEPSRAELTYDGKPSLGILIAAMSGTDITQLGKEVDAVIDRIGEEVLPAGVDVEKVFNQPERVSVALNGFLLNLLESIVIVVVLLMFTMGLRSGMIIGINLLVIVLGSLMILNIFDGTLQRVSLGAFIIAMGMLVDNAIVIVDGIQMDLQRGVSRKEALTAIGRKTAMPLLGATLIAILAFFPIFLSPDTAGVYVRDLFVVLAVSLLLSWVLALTLVPIQADKRLKVKPGKEGKDPYGSKAYRALRSTVHWAISHKTLTISIAVVLAALSAYLYTLLPQGFFPDFDYDQLYIEYKLPEGNNSSRVREDLASIEQYLMQRDDVEHVTASVGGTPGRYNLVRSVATPSLSYGELIVDFTTSKELVASIPAIQQYLTDAYPDAYVRVKRYNLMYKDYPIEVAFRGPDPAVLRELTAQAMEIFEESPDVFLVTSDWESPQPVLEIDYNQPIARSVGLSRQDVGLSVLAATDGIPASVFYDGKDSETIYLKCVDKEGKPIESLENSPVFAMMPSIGGIDRQTMLGLMSGAISEEDVLEAIFQTVPLSQVANGVRVIWEEPVVLRSDGQRVMRAQGNPVFGISAADAVQTVKKQVESIELPEGYSMAWEGELKASGDSMKYLFKNFPLAIMMMIAILIFLFKDYKKPLIIMCCIPLMMIGVVMGMFISGKTFTFVATVAALGLIGMILKNGIVLMDEVSLQVNEGKDPENALLDASSNRFRPVMMASMTTILGMIPLLGDDMFGPGAVTIMGGLFVGTLITLLFVPVLYAVFFKVKVKKQKKS